MCNNKTIKKKKEKKEIECIRDEACKDELRRIALFVVKKLTIHMKCLQSTIDAADLLE